MLRARAHRDAADSRITMTLADRLLVSFRVTCRHTRYSCRQQSARSMILSTRIDTISPCKWTWRPNAVPKNWLTSKSTKRVRLMLLLTKCMKVRAYQMSKDWLKIIKIQRKSQEAQHLTP
jgi:hypothetical protein